MADSMRYQRQAKAVSLRDANQDAYKQTSGSKISPNPQSSAVAETARTAERGIHQANRDAKRRTKFEDQSKVGPVYKWR